MNLIEASNGITGLDKNYSEHKFNNIGYLNIYDSYFSNIKDDVKTILEIGVLGGASLKLWDKYFGNSKKIIGIDVNPECKNLENNEITIIVKDQSDETLVDDVKKILYEIGENGLDIIIDDGSHVNSKTIKTFELLFPLLNSGGLYCIEDMYVSYLDLKDHIPLWPNKEYMGMDKIFNDNENKRGTINNFLEDKIKLLDYAKGEIMSFHIYSQLIIMEKI
jgi:hypothetical protein